jgi:two-component system, LuxR family, response regulator FixJ
MADKLKSRIDSLTPRQREVVRLTSLGLTVNEIAKVLGIAPSTADNHRSRAMKILGTDRAVLLARIAIKYKISSMTDRLTLAERRKRGKRKDVWN